MLLVELGLRLGLAIMSATDFLRSFASVARVSLRGFLDTRMLGKRGKGIGMASRSRFFKSLGWFQ